MLVRSSAVRGAAELLILAQEISIQMAKQTNHHQEQPHWRVVTITWSIKSYKQNIGQQLTWSTEPTRIFNHLRYQYRQYYFSAIKVRGPRVDKHASMFAEPMAHPPFPLMRHAAAEPAPQQPNSHNNLPARQSYEPCWKIQVDAKIMAMIEEKKNENDYNDEEQQEAQDMDVDSDGSNLAEPEPRVIGKKIRRKKKTKPTPKMNCCKRTKIQRGCGWFQWWWRKCRTGHWTHASIHQTRWQDGSKKLQDMTNSNGNKQMQAQWQRENDLQRQLDQDQAHAQRYRQNALWMGSDLSIRTSPWWISLGSAKGWTCFPTSTTAWISKGPIEWWPKTTISPSATTKIGPANFPRSSANHEQGTAHARARGT